MRRISRLPRLAVPGSAVDASSSAGGSVAVAGGSLPAATGSMPDGLR
jgi:hypothetical protein